MRSNDEEAFSAFSAKASALLKLVERHGIEPQAYQKVEAQLRELREQIENEQNPVRVVLVGHFNAGKSAFINNLLGIAICGESNKPLTSAITKIRYGSKLKFWALDRHGSKRKVTRLQYNKWSTRATSRSEGDINNFEIEFPSEVLKHITIIDTPGLKSGQDVAAGELVRKAVLKYADVVVLLQDIEDGAIKADVADAISKIFSIKPGLRSILLVTRSENNSARERIADEIFKKNKSKFRIVSHFIFSARPRPSQKSYYQAQKRAFFQAVRALKVASQVGHRKEFNRRVQEMGQELQRLHRLLKRKLVQTARDIDTGKFDESLRNLKSSMHETVLADYLSPIHWLAKSGTENFQILDREKRGFLWSTTFYALEFSQVDLALGLLRHSQVASCKLAMKQRILIKELNKLNGSLPTELYARMAKAAVNLHYPMIKYTRSRFNRLVKRIGAGRADAEALQILVHEGLAEPYDLILSNFTKRFEGPGSRFEDAYGRYQMTFAERLQARNAIHGLRLKEDVVNSMQHSAAAAVRRCKRRLRPLVGQLGKELCKHKALVESSIKTLRSFRGNDFKPDFGEAEHG